MNNKLLRLVELVQEDYPDELLEILKHEKKMSLIDQLELISRARTFHQQRSETLWLKAGKKRSPAERQAAAQADIASFVTACLTGETREYADSAVAALGILGRQGEIGLIAALNR